MYLLTLPALAGEGFAILTGDDCQLRTQTQGGWGAPPNGNNPGAYLHANFAGAFPGGVTIGCENTLVFTSAQAITNFLPSGGPPSVLPSGTWVNPTGYGNVLAGQLLAATISVGMDAYDPGFGASSTLLGNAIVASGPFAGWTVNAVLAAANDFIGGCGGSYTAPQFNSVLTAINENFTGGNTNNGFLICSESEECEAYAGTLAGFKPTDCLQEGGTAIGGIPIGDAVVPPGYQIAWVLTQGPGLVIIEVRDIPIFDVYAEAFYTIHTLVYNPATLDLTSIVLGVTTGFDIAALLIENGGDICASLDVTGTSVLVENPDAGSLTGFKDEDCLEEGGTVIGATPNGDMHVPPGYQVLYVLTQGPGLVIVDVSPAPFFTVNDLGLYTIHTLVYDPATLNLGGVVIGVTTGFEVNSLLIQGGGVICAALDVAGAPIDIIDCPDEECEADAGTLSYDGGEWPCLSEGGSVALSATPNGDAVVPAGYQVLYVLTQGPGLVIVDVSADPSFSVSTAGSYTIHTLVYDPATLDLSIVVPGVTTGFDVNSLLIQGGGEICGNLDVAGVSFEVENCPPPPAGPCCTSNGTPGCDDAACQAVICASDPFCCNTQWDGICAGSALANANAGGACADVSNCPSGPPPPPECVEAPECVLSDPEAYATVIADDSFCCEVQWDGLCQSAFDAISDSCGGQSCVEAPNCVLADQAAYNTVVANDPFCCETFWDGLCQSAFDEISDSCTGSGVGPCCSSHQGVGCEDAACQAVICASDPFCCNTQWDGICAGSALANANAGGACADVSNCPSGPPPPPECVEAPECVLSDPEAYATVIADDSFCCEVQWDGLCQSAFDAISDSCGGQSCVEAPNCVLADQAAYNTVVANDPFCCETFWDGLCQSAFDEISDSCTGSGVGPCCSSHQGVGCEDAACQAVICASDPFCCNTQWDGICAGSALANANAGGACADVSNCPSGPPPPPECVEAPECVLSDPEAYATVIADDSFCCEVQWDGLCQSAFDAISDSCGGQSCVEAPNCVLADQAAYNTVVANDPFCCETFWDGLCQSAFDEISDSCTGSGVGPCCSSHQGVGCEDAACQAVICASDPFCCNTQWDGICAGSALANANAGGACADVSNCPSGPPPPPECVEAPECVLSDPEAYATVIADDSFCCEVQWDGLCQSAFDAISDSCTGPVCVEVPACVAADQAAYETVVAADSWCCEVEWDFICQDAFDAISDSCTGPVCVEAPACVLSDPEAYAAVLAVDPFCCETAWDLICQAQFDELSDACVPPPPVCVEVPECVAADQAAYETVVAADSWCCEVEWDFICQDAFDAISDSCTGPVCVEAPACVLSDPEAYAAVLAVDPFCCETAWDLICQAQFDELSDACVPPPPVCVEVPECVAADQAAYETVVAADSWCCEVEWDFICQDAFDAISDSCTGPVCVEVPACVAADQAAYETVVAADPFCCESGWDSICQDAFDAISDSCTGPACVEVPACVAADQAAYETVVAADAWCCEVEWDFICQEAFDAISDSCTGPVCVEVPDCVAADQAAYNTVVADDPFCCESGWDFICQEAFDAISDSCTGPVCVEAPACVLSDPEAYAAVLAADAFCCDTFWDGLCQTQFDALSDACGGPSCVEAPACVLADQAAYETVVAADPFCCNTQWDGICQDAFDAISDSCTGPVCVGVPECVAADQAAYNTVVADDPFCCETFWDGLCQSAFDAISDSCDGGVSLNPCCTSHTGTGCEDAACQSFICAADPFCCNTQWDGLCSGAAIANAGNGGVCSGVSNCPSGGGIIQEDPVALSFTMWPNPTNQFLFVKAEADLDPDARIELTVWSMQGAQVMPTSQMMDRERTVIDVSNLTPGQYLLRMVVGDQVVIDRFMKMD
ncbi:MAG: T9SS type A sorting domain-containing protein [Flavobacteriales bacterium]|nr:T9SS type A sorting domain-containing protein [Flavobacteriales bacterium]